MFTMVNSDEFSKRLQQVFEYYDLNASAFADKIGVGRASISHLLSGRNKPSLDFVMRVIKNFPDVELYWLLNGKGEFPKNEIKKSKTESAPPLSQSNPYSEKNVSKYTDNLTAENSVSDTSEIERIVIFFKNGSFKNYTTE